ncbi:MAG TPA: hypothetical protein VLB73_01235, partial [Patescibacteria group bacterium]|nr:hypothetical protein [Patescibacteria group bacterium]
IGLPEKRQNAYKNSASNKVKNLTKISKPSLPLPTLLSLAIIQTSKERELPQSRIQLSSSLKNKSSRGEPDTRLK